MAGGQVPIVGKNLEEIVADLKKRFLWVMGESGDGEPLL